MIPYGALRTQVGTCYLPSWMVVISSRKLGVGGLTSLDQFGQGRLAIVLYGGRFAGRHFPGSAVPAGRLGWRIREGQRNCS